VKCWTRSLCAGTCRRCAPGRAWQTLPATSSIAFRTPVP
jgi:hypothetical protein